MQKKDARAKPLVKQEAPDEVVAWYCSGCGIVYKTEGEANGCLGCHWPSCPCGEPIERYRTKCSKCMKKESDEREQARLESAPRIPRGKYPVKQPIVSDGEFYREIDDLIEHCRDIDAPLPKLVWATKERRFQLNLEDALEAQWENFVDGCEDIEEPHYEREAELREAVKSFNEAQTYTLHFETDQVVDISDVVMFDDDDD